MGKRVFYDQHIRFLREHSGLMSNEDLTILFNQHFGMQQTLKSIQKIKTTNKIKSPKQYQKYPKILKTSYTAQEIDFIRKNAKGCSNEDLTSLFNSHFGTTRSVKAIVKCKHKNRIFSGIVYVPTYSEGKPIGSIHNKSGKKYIKIGDNKWIPLHKHIWQEANGPIPPKHIVIFGDRDCNNFNLDNLILVSRQQLITMNTTGLIQDDANLTRIGVQIADLVNVIGKRNIIPKKG